MRHAMQEQLGVAALGRIVAAERTERGAEKLNPLRKRKQSRQLKQLAQSAPKQQLRALRWELRVKPSKLPMRRPCASAAPSPSPLIKLACLERMKHTYASATRWCDTLMHSRWHAMLVSTSSSCSEVEH